MSFNLSSCGFWLLLLIMLILPQSFHTLRCYVCGGNSGTPCNSEDLDQSGLVGIHDPVQECNDLINNRGCVKQFVNGVVLLRGCWLDGTNKCLRNGAAEVCTCSKDLCNSSSRNQFSYLIIILPLLLTAFSVGAQSIPAITLTQPVSQSRARHKNQKKNPSTNPNHQTKKKRSEARLSFKLETVPLVVS